MNKATLKNIETAEKALKTRLPAKLREFILDLPDHEIEIGDHTWLFRVVGDEAYSVKKNPMVYDSQNIRKRWKLPVVIIADNGVDDYLVVMQPEGKDECDEVIYQLITYDNKIEYFAPDILSAYSGKFSPDNFDNFVTYRLDDNDGVTMQKGLEHFQTGQPTGERFYLDKYDQLKSETDDMIDDEDTDATDKILRSLHELTEQPDYAAWAWYKLSDLYFKGFGPLSKNIEQAIEYNLRAVELGHAKSTANRAYCYFSGMGLPKDIDKAYELIKAANDSTTGGSGKEKDGLYYDMFLTIKSAYLKEKKEKMISVPVQQHILEVLQQETGSSISSVKLHSVGGGSINHTYKIVADNDALFFCKINSRAKFPGLFTAEQQGLELLAAQKIIRVPRVICSTVFEDVQLLILEWIEQGARTAVFWQLFGEQLAALHDVGEKMFGLPADNYMGSLVQKNELTDNWQKFFTSRRLQPQVDMAVQSGLLTAREAAAFEKVYARLDNLFPGASPRLLHGDLWSGNFLCDAKSRPVLIDPAVYYGHPAVDMAMTTLFGGFDKPFYDSYNACKPFPPNYREQWEVCNLYPLLIHLNLFGESYKSAILHTIHRY